MENPNIVHMICVCVVVGVLTSNVAAVGVVDFLHVSVPEGEFSHPVHTTSNAGRQTQSRVRRCCTETV